MAAIIWTDVTAIAPELSEVAAGAQTDILAYVNDILNVSNLDGETGYMTRLARIFLAAHFGTVAGAGGAAGPVSSESAGGLSRSYATMATSSALGATAYGVQFRAVVRPRTVGPVVL